MRGKKDMDYSVGHGKLKAKHCPFCGSNSICVYWLDRSWVGYCDECDGRGPINIDQAKAIVLWNKREPIPKEAKNVR